MHKIQESDRENHMTGVNHSLVVIKIQCLDVNVWITEEKKLVCMLFG